MAQLTGPQLLKWLETASHDEMMEMAPTQDTNTAIVIYENVKLGEQCPSDVKVRADLRRTQLLVGLDVNYGKHSLQRAVRDAKKKLPPNDPDFIAAKKLLNQVIPPDPDKALLEDHLDQINDLFSHLSKNRTKGEDDVRARMALIATPQWMTIFDAQAFNNHVQWEGMHGYFANTLGEDRLPAVEAFKAINKKMAGVVEEAFDAFEKVSEKHRQSSENRSADSNVYDIKPAKEMPGYIEEEDHYKEVEAKYLKLAEGFDDLMVKYIKKNQDKLPKLEP